MTLEPAKMLGVADHIGSLEPGKDATLIVTDGARPAPTSSPPTWTAARSTVPTSKSASTSGTGTARSPPPAASSRPRAGAPMRLHQPIPPRKP
jgi:hypothetical protein